MAKVGRPTSYKPEMCEQVFEMALLGLTDAQMAKVLGVSEVTFNQYKNIPEFLKSLTQGKEDADAKVAKAMYKRALGLTITEDALTRDGDVVQLKKELPPDTAAAKHWLANRQRGLWANNGENTIKTDQPIVITLTEREADSEANGSV
jgi:transcriptional regulator with XRE-family HTH domain